MSQEKELILNTVAEIQETVELFYQQKQKKALTQMDVVLGDIVKAVDVLFAYKKENDSFPLDEERVSSSLKECMNALEDSDFILMADIFQYDFIEYMEELAAEMV